MLFAVPNIIVTLETGSKGIFSDAKIRMIRPANDARQATGVMRGRAGLEKRKGREKKARPRITPVASRASFAGERERKICFAV